MPRRWVLWSLFVSSYTPLFFLIGLRAINHSQLIAVASGVLVVLGAGGTLLFLVTAHQKALGDYQLLEVENRDPDVAAYAATYLLPFLTVFSGSWQDVASLVGFIGILGVIYVRSRLIYINPVLTVLGFRLWRVIPLTPGAVADPDHPPWPRFLLTTSGRLQRGDVISARRLTDDLLLAENGAVDDSAD
jgi:hypothetical protein